MLTRRKFIVLLTGTAPIAAGAVLGLRLLPSDAGSADQPEIVWGEHSCAHCGMIISDRRYAAAWIEPGGDQSRFDDVGCMVSRFREQPPPNGTRLFVRDFLADGWLDAKSAAFLSAASLRSPMAYGVGAFVSEAAGRDELGGDVMRVWAWGELVDGLDRMG